MVTLVVNIELQNSYKEIEDIVMLRVTEKEIEEAFPEIIHRKKQKQTNKRKRKYQDYLRNHLSIRHYFGIYHKLPEFKLNE